MWEGETSLPYQLPAAAGPTNSLSGKILPLPVSQKSVHGLGGGGSGSTQENFGRPYRCTYDMLEIGHCYSSRLFPV